MAKPKTSTEGAPPLPTVDGIDALMATMGVSAVGAPTPSSASGNDASPLAAEETPVLDPGDPALKTQTKRIWGAVKKAERKVQQGEVQRTSVALPLELHTQIRIAAIQRRESFNDWINEAIRQRLAREGG